LYSQVFSKRYGCRFVDLVVVAEGDSRKGDVPYGVGGRLYCSDCRTLFKPQPHNPHHDYCNSDADDAHNTPQQPVDFSPLIDLMLMPLNQECLDWTAINIGRHRRYK